MLGTSMIVNFYIQWSFWNFKNFNDQFASTLWL